MALYQLLHESPPLPPAGEGWGEGLCFLWQNTPHPNPLPRRGMGTKQCLQAIVIGATRNWYIAK